MRKVDNKILICEKTGLTLNEYDKIVKYLNEQGFDTTFGETKGFVDVQVMMKNADSTARKEFKVTNAEQALAEEIGVDAQDLARLGQYFGNLRREANTSSFMVFGDNEFVTQGAMRTFSDGRGTWENVCNRAEIDYKNFVEHETPQADGPAPATTLSTYTHGKYDVMLRETKDGIEVFKINEKDNWFNFGKEQSETLVSTIPMTDSADRKEFISEFSEQIDKLGEKGFNNFFKDDKQILAEYATKIADEIKSEKEFLDEKDAKQQNQLEDKADDLRKTISNLDQKIIDADTSKAVETLAEIRTNIAKQLDTVENQLDALKEKEVLNAETAKYELLERREELNAELKNLEECYETASKSSRKLLDARKEALEEKIDEVNDKYRAATEVLTENADILAAHHAKFVPIEEINTTAREAGKAVTEVGVEISEASKEEAEKVTKETKSGIIKIDNILGDLKDWAQDLQEKFQDSSFGKGLSNLYENIQEKFGELRENAGELAADIAAKGADVAAKCSEVGKEIIDKATKEIEELKDKDADKEVDLTVDAQQLD